MFFSTEYDLCPCFKLPDSFKSALSTMMDVSLLKDPVFMFIGISNVFGMAGLYVPFVYLVEYAMENVNIFLNNFFWSNHLYLCIFRELIKVPPHFYYQ